jgi:hypothetical protein
VDLKITITTPKRTVHFVVLICASSENETYRLRERTQPLDKSYPNLTPTVFSDPVEGDLGHKDSPNSAGTGVGSDELTSLAESGELLT